MLVNFINGIEPNPKFKLASYANKTINHDNQHLRQTHNDTFVYNKNNLTFTSLFPKDKVIPLYAETLVNLDEAKTISEISELAKKLKLELRAIKNDVLATDKSVNKSVVDDIHGNKYDVHLQYFELPEEFIKRSINKNNNLQGEITDETYLEIVREKLKDVIKKFEERIPIDLK